MNKLSNIMMTVGMGPRNTIIVGLIADGSHFGSLSLNREQCLNHIEILQRHLSYLPEADVNERMIAHSGLN